MVVRILIRVSKYGAVWSNVDTMSSCPKPQTLHNVLDGCLAEQFESVGMHRASGL